MELFMSFAKLYTHNVASAISRTDLVFMRRSRLFLGQCGVTPPWRFSLLNFKKFPMCNLVWGNLLSSRVNSPTSSGIFQSGPRGIFSYSKTVANIFYIFVYLHSTKYVLYCTLNERKYFKHIL